MFTDKRVALLLKKSISGVLYRKMLRLTNKSLHQVSTEKIISIVSSELEILEKGLTIAPYLFIAPLLWVVSLGFIFVMVGPISLITLAILLLVVLLQKSSSSKLFLVKKVEAKFNEQRIKVITNLIQGIKAVKNYGWEYAFLLKLSDLRRS